MLITAVFCVLSWGTWRGGELVEPTYLEPGGVKERWAAKDLGSPLLLSLSGTHGPSCAGSYFSVSFWMILSLSGH